LRKLKEAPAGSDHFPMVRDWFAERIAEQIDELETLGDGEADHEFLDMWRRLQVLVETKHFEVEARNQAAIVARSRGITL
jgi:hypothetical protein